VIALVSLEVIHHETATFNDKAHRLQTPKSARADMSYYRSQPRFPLPGALVGLALVVVGRGGRRVRRASEGKR
jgi:hypothetical protein